MVPSVLGAGSCRCAVVRVSTSISNFKETLGPYEIFERLWEKRA